MVYPELYYRSECECGACELGRLLTWTEEDEHTVRAEWSRYWDRHVAGTLHEWEEPCNRAVWAFWNVQRPILHQANGV